ncbi:hypothetical protein ACN47A_20980 [Myxococcus fulvus]|uniref:hypothetical protein n=1 Tax=Myxococcus fulvus TaxID=33 RepID=UPI003B9BBE66
MVSLWDMLSLLLVASTVGGALGGALRAGGGFARLGLGLLVGLGLGVLLAVGFRRLGSDSPLRLRWLYVAAAVWVILPGPLLGHWMAHGLMRLVLASP